MATGETINGFRIDWRESSKAGNWTGANEADGTRTVNNGAATSVTLTRDDDGLTQNIEYEFRIRSMRTGTGDTNSWFTGNEPPMQARVRTADIDPVDPGVATVPAAPVLTATAHATADELAVLSWTEPDDGGSAITGYRWEGRNAGSSIWSSIGNTEPGVTTVSPQTSVTAASEFRIRAMNAVGNSPWSDIRTVAAPPGIPTGLAASGVQETQVTLGWTAPTQTGGKAVSYTYQWGPDDGGATWPNEDTASAATADVTGLTAGTAYQFRVRAVNEDRMSGWTARITETTTAAAQQAPAVPANLRFKSAAATEIKVDWDMPAGIDSSADFPDGVVLQLEYRLATATAWTRRSNPPAFVDLARRAPGTVYTSTYPGLTEGAAYAMRLRLCERGSDGSATSNCSAWSATLEATAQTTTTPPPQPPPPTPTQPPAQVAGVTVTPGVGALAVRWNAAARAARYRVQWKSGSETFANAATDNRQAETTGTSHTIPGLMAGTDYTVRVIATNSAGDGTASADSAPASPTAALRLATTPARLTEDNVDDATVTLRLAGATWSDPALVTVTGLPGVTARDAARVSDSEARITLSYTPEGADGLEGDAVLTVTAAAASHSGPAALTGTVTVHARSAPAALAATRWLSRFGRTVADHVMAAVGARLSEPAGQRDRLRLAGRSLYSPAALLNPPPARREGSGEGLAACAAACGASPAAALDAANVANGGVGTAGLAAGPLTRPLPASGERGIAVAQALVARDLLAGTSFRVSAAEGEGIADMGWTAWGRVDLSGFDGDEGGLALDGDTMTATVGADIRRGRLLAGVAAAHSAGNGEYRTADGAAAGDLDASLASVHPYVRIEAAGGLSLWGVLGWGEGDMTLDRRDGDGEKADLEMTMAGAGARGPLPSPSDGMALALRAEAFGSRIEADGGGDALREAEAEAWRMRLALEASWDETEAGLRPSASLGLHHDGGDGETGTGAELGGGVAWAGPDGLSASLRARALLDGDGVSEWGGGAMLAYAPGAEGRGLRLSLAPSVGAPEGGVEQLWRADAAALASERDARPRLDAEAGYDIAVLGGRGLLTPHAGLALADAGERRTRLGARLTLGPGADLALAAERADRPAGPEHALTLNARLRW